MREFLYVIFVEIFYDCYFCRLPPLLPTLGWIAAYKVLLALLFWKIHFNYELMRAKFCLSQFRLSVEICSKQEMILRTDKQSTTKWRNLIEVSARSCEDKCLFDFILYTRKNHLQTRKWLNEVRWNIFNWKVCFICNPCNQREDINLWRFEFFFLNNVSLSLFFFSLWLDINSHLRSNRRF